MSTIKNANSQDAKLVFARYITKNGKRIYPKNGKVFCFYVNE